MYISGLPLTYTKYIFNFMKAKNAHKFEKGSLEVNPINKNSPKKEKKIQLK